MMKRLAFALAVLLAVLAFCRIVHGTVFRYVADAVQNRNAVIEQYLD